MEKSTQISPIIKYQKKDLRLFGYQFVFMNLLLEEAKIIILKCFQKNVNMLLTLFRSKKPPPPPAFPL